MTRDIRVSVHFEAEPFVFQDVSDGDIRVAVNHHLPDACRVKACQYDYTIPLTTDDPFPFVSLLIGDKTGQKDSDERVDDITECVLTGVDSVVDGVLESHEVERV